MTRSISLSIASSSPGVRASVTAPSNIGRTQRFLKDRTPSSKMSRALRSTFSSILNIAPLPLRSRRPPSMSFRRIEGSCSFSRRPGSVLGRRRPLRTASGSLLFCGSDGSRPSAMSVPFLSEARLARMSYWISEEEGGETCSRR